jgi:hypothetical protein
MSWVGHVSCAGKGRSVYRVLVGTHGGKRTLGRSTQWYASKEDCNISLKVLFIWGWKAEQLFDAAVYFPSYMLLFTCVFEHISRHVAEYSICVRHLIYVLLNSVLPSVIPFYPTISLERKVTVSVSVLLMCCFWYCPCCSVIFCS